MKKYIEQLYAGAVDLNRKNIRGLLDCDPNAHFLDLGCDDGKLTIDMAGKIGTKNISGVEIVDSRIQMALAKGVQVKKFDLNGEFDFPTKSVDAVHANQVIEHLYDSDKFVGEIYRILKNGGYAVISTENASSWCNIFASIMGWQIFSLTNFSSKQHGIGNPFALHRDDSVGLASWNHVRIYNIRGLKEYFEAFGFKVEKIRGAGYFPLPASFGNIDKTHSHFMTFKLRKN
uniref:class I SAM-dependent methyltransferase n=1 Tax=Flavobacterium sp. TaxID=239 RepID=UPI0040470E8D